MAAKQLGLVMASDGLEVFLIGSGNNRFHSYTMSTAFDLSTAVYDNYYDLPFLRDINFDILDIVVSEDGLQLFGITIIPKRKLKSSP